MFERHPAGLVLQILILLFKKHLRANKVQMPSYILNVMVYHFAMVALDEVKAPQPEKDIGGAPEFVLFTSVLHKFIEFYGNADPADEAFWREVASSGEKMSDSQAPHIFGYQEQLAQMKKCFSTFP